MSVTPFNNLSPAEAERLALLAEEAGEIVQAIGKILRHGFKDGDYDNRAHLELEIGNLQATLYRMSDEGDLSWDHIRGAQSSHFEKQKRWTHHQPDSIKPYVPPSLAPPEPEKGKSLASPAQPIKRQNIGEMMEELTQGGRRDFEEEK